MKKIRDYYVIDRIAGKIIGVVPAINDMVAKRLIKKSLSELFSKGFLDVDDIVVLKMSFSHEVYETISELQHGYYDEDGEKQSVLSTDISDYIFDIGIFEKDKEE